MALFLLLSCKLFDAGFLCASDKAIFKGTISWPMVLEQMDPAFEIIIVERDGSIQEIVDETLPGDVLYVESGVYKEALVIDKPDLRLIGLPGPDRGKVVLINPGEVVTSITLQGDGERSEIIDISPENFKQTGAKILTFSETVLPQSGSRVTVTRKELGDDVVHYIFEVALGENQFDLIRIHRVVKEDVYTSLPQAQPTFSCFMGLCRRASIIP